jgi:hypothetical protein
MLKREITFEDFNGLTCTETFYFNLSKSEILSLEASQVGGFKASIEKIIETENAKDLIEQFQLLILMAYGEKSDDGKRFVKSEEIKEAFKQSPAYDILFMELATNDKLAADFMLGIMPKDLAKAAENELESKKEE